VKQKSYYLILIIYALVTLLPILWAGSISIKPKEDLWQIPPVIISENPTSNHYSKIFTDSEFAVNLGNSFYVSIGTLFISLPLSILAAFAFARWRFKGRVFWLILILASQMIPGMASLVPLYSILKSIGMLDTRLGLILIFSAQTIPLNIWIFKGFFETIPRALTDAALIDGCSPLATLPRIILPISAPGIIAASLFTIMRPWNDFLVALTLLFDPNKMTFPPALYKLYSSPIAGTNYGAIFAGSLIGTMPIVIIFLFFQKYFISGLTSGAMKA
jgi:ABC-type glycerol-3-phosphate transport system permease component